MTDGGSDRDIDLLEFERLRCEIDGRTQLAFGLVTLNITAIGVGFSVIASFPDVVFGLAIVSCILWMLYIDHSAQVQKIAAYIGLRLAPRLRGRDGQALGWEAFLRDLDGTPESIRAALGLPRDATVRVYRSPAIRQAMSALFGGAAPVLIVLGIFRSADSHHLGWQRWAVIAGATCVWVYAVRFYLMERRTWKTIDSAFRRLASGSTPVAPAEAAPIGPVAVAGGTGPSTGSAAGP